MRTVKYTNIKTGQEIDSDCIYEITEEGIFLFSPVTAAITFIGREDLKIEETSLDREELLAPVPVYPDKTDTESFSETAEDTGATGDSYEYLFGLDTLELTGTQPMEASGFITSEIDIGSCSYIELSVKISGTDIMPEFYILEGNTETPILPAEQTGVSNELLFFGLGTRFEPDRGKDITIFKNGMPTGYGPDDTEAFEFGSDRYTISYTPSESAYKYYPEKNKIKIKVIQRCSDGCMPGTISSMVILKHGGIRAWTM